MNHNEQSFENCTCPQVPGNDQDIMNDVVEERFTCNIDVFQGCYWSWNFAQKKNHGFDKTLPK